MIAVARSDRTPRRLADLLDLQASLEPDRTAFRFIEDGTERAVTYAQLDRYARGFAARLREHVRPGDRALLLYAPGFEYVVALLGCAFAGVVAVPLFPPRVARTLPRVAAILRDAGAAVALTTARFLERIAAKSEPALDNDVCWCVLEPEPADVETTRYDADRPAAAGEIALLQYTSGSTGTPKGVVLTHANLLANLAMIAAAFGLRRDECGVTWLPPYHDMGLIGGTLAPLAVGFTAIVLPPLAFLQRPLGWLKTISRFGAGITGAPNFAYELCAEKLTPERAGDLDLSCVRVAFVGAEPVRAATLDRFAAAFAPYGFRRSAFAPCYGLAEATLLVSGLAGAGPVTHRLRRSALAQGLVVAADGTVGDDCEVVGCGPLADGVEVRITDAQGAPVGPGAIGEIGVGGPGIAAGYWNRPAETAQTFRRLDDGRTFMLSGDLGYLAEGGGVAELVVTGRRKELIIIRGRNLYPRDVEEVAGRAHRLVQPDACAAFAVDTAGGEGLTIIAEHRGAPPAADLEAAATAIRAAVTTEIDIAPHAVVLVRSGTIPRTSSGKLQRLRTRDLYVAGTLAPAR